eukprot:m.7560 g.7560  ORF g.7560 m.7560 type:complete len:159 (-) comp5263_c0_seq1:5364-5840(-)
MADHYAVLGVSRDATTAVIRKRYFELSRVYHPDKQAGTVTATSTATSKSQADSDATFQSATAQFHAISEAWRVLQDDESRRIYDATLAYGTMSQEQPYQDEVTIGEMELIEDDGVYVYECRCSGEYLLEIEDVDGDHPYYIVPCDSCSLAIKVTATQS